MPTANTSVSAPGARPRERTFVLTVTTPLTGSRGITHEYVVVPAVWSEHAVAAPVPENCHDGVSVNDVAAPDTADANSVTLVSGAIVWLVTVPVQRSGWPASTGVPGEYAVCSKRSAATLACTVPELSPKFPVWSFIAR